MTNVRDSRGMIAVETLLLSAGRLNWTEVEALLPCGLVEWTGDTYRLTEKAADMKERLHKARGDDRWELCKAYAKQLDEARGSRQGELFG